MADRRSRKQYVEPVITNAAPTFAPNLSATSVLRLQRVQSAALRIITGCHSATRWEYLNQETKILPVGDKLDLLCRQFLVSALRPGHPSHDVVRSDPGPRRMKETLGTKYGDDVSPFLVNGVIVPYQYPAVISSLHTQAVRDSITNLGENHLLQSVPLPIDDSETALNRRERTTLAQLRTGDCSNLKDYQMRIGKSDNALCPECKFKRHSVPHLFNCDAVPTVLNVSDLWCHPIAVVNHLKKLSSFNTLNAHGPPLPRPPPEPDP